MAYTHTSFGDLKTALAQRLADTSNRFWTDEEKGLYLAESFRTFGVVSSFWRDRGILTLTASTTFFDLTSSLSGSLLSSTITDRDLIKQIQYALLEPTSTQSSWPGSAQFTYNDIVNAIRRRRDQFLADTGIILSHSTVAVASPPVGRQQLTDTIIDVRRAAFRASSPTDYYYTLWRSDERELVLSDASWNVSSSIPAAYSVLAPPPLTLQLAPPPTVSGTLDLITVNSGPTLDPASSGTALGLPDDLTPAIKWGALADLLGIDGQARDSARSLFCESRYQQFVQLARLLSCVINVELNGVSTVPVTLFELDSGVSNWQNITGSPSYIALAGWNLIAAHPQPDSNGPYSATFDVVRKANVPSTDGTNVQLGREQLDMILDYAEHLALFKVGGYEFQATERQAQNFLLQSITYNQRLAASAKYIVAPKESSQREKAYRIRRQQSDGLGALPSIQEAQSFVAGNAPIRMKRS